MTDKYESDAHEHDMPAEHNAGESQGWGNEPPVDDFHAGEGEEGATVSEETDMHDEAAHGDMAADVAKKKSIKLPILAAVGGVLVLGAVVYWQFGASSDAVVVPPPPPLATQPPSPAASPSMAAAADVVPTTSLGPVADTTAVNLPPKPAPVAVPTPPAPEPVAAVPAPMTPTPAPAVVAAAAPVVAPVVTSAPVADTASVDARLNALAARVEDMQKTLLQATQQLNQVSTDLASKTGSYSASFDDRLNKIEQKLAQAQPPAFVSAEPPVKIVHHVVSRHHAVRTTAVVKASHKRLIAAKHVPVQSFTWVLRAATPDEAWVAVNDTTPELRHIKVGDSLPGIGPVRAIHQSGDAWMVEGAQGTVR